MQDALTKLFPSVPTVVSIDVPTFFMMACTSATLSAKGTFSLTDCLEYLAMQDQVQ
jgi:hypothetical protein